MNWYKITKLAQTISLADHSPSNKGYISFPAVYLRFGDIPIDAQGNQVNSIAFGDPLKQEKGISVYKAWHDPKTGKYVLESGSEQMLAGQTEVDGRPCYLVTGEDNGDSGDDGEDLLVTGTVKIIGTVSYDDIVMADDPWITFSGIELDEEQIPNWYPGGREAQDKQEEEDRIAKDKRYEEDRIKTEKDQADRKMMYQKMVETYPELKEKLKDYI